MKECWLALIFVSANQAAVIAPASVAQKQVVSVRLRYKSKLSAGLELPVAQSYPQFFTSNQQGFGPIAALNQDFSVNTADNPVVDGTVLQMFGTDFGLYDDSCLEDELAPSDRLLSTQATFDITFGGQTQQLAFRGAAPGQVCALGQANVVVNSGALAGTGTTEAPVSAEGFKETETTVWVAPAP